MDVYEESLMLHKEKNGKIEIQSKIKLRNKKDLSLAYTPGVAGVCKAIASSPEKAYEYTLKGNTVAIVSDGSAVLGLGNIGAQAAIPVMEGKALLFKEFAGINAFPLCFENQNPQGIIEAVKNIAPVFGAVNLEDIKAPQCFEIEAALQDIGIPVMHDDQHGTAIVILAALMNAAKVVGKELEDLQIVVNGAGAAGTAVTKLLSCVGYDRRICHAVKDIIVLDSQGTIYQGRGGLNRYKDEISKITNKSRIKGTLKDAVKGADVFIGVSVAGALKPEMIGEMDKPIIFAMANPVPEIMPNLAKKAGAVVIGTGRSDFPNQVNNALAFPGVFLGALHAHARMINNEMKLAAAYALSQCVSSPNAEKIIPDPFDKKVVPAIAAAVRKAAQETGVVRKGKAVSAQASG